MPEIESSLAGRRGVFSQSSLSRGLSRSQSGERGAESGAGGREVTIVTLSESFVFELRPGELVRDLKRRIFTYLRRNSERRESRMRLIYLGKLLEDNTVVESVVRPRSTIHCVINLSAPHPPREDDHLERIDNNEFIVDIGDVPEDNSANAWAIPSVDGNEEEDEYSCQMFAFGVFLGFELVGLLIRLTSPNLRKEIKAGISVGLALRLAFVLLQTLLGFGSSENDARYAIENKMFERVN